LPERGFAFRRLPFLLMFPSIKRLQLQRRGLATTRKRRKQGESEIRQMLEQSPLIKALIFLGFYGGLIALIYSADVRQVFGQDPLKASVIGGLVFFAAFVQFYANHPISFAHNGRTMLMFGAVLVQLSLVRLCSLIVDLLPALNQSAEMGQHFLFLLIPYALAPMALSVLLGRRQAVFATIFGGIFGCLIVEETMLYDFLLGSLLAGMVAVYATHDLRKRGRLMRAGCYVGLISLILSLILGHISLLEDFSAISPPVVGVQILTVLLVGIITAGIVGGFLPLLEGLFGITTNITWLELADLNHKLLKRMTIEAPGTYHHSLVVARIAESAAEKIGANAIQCQVCSYFHDIGKLKKPTYFIENINPEDNPHDDLSPSMSVLVILSHVKEGVDLALKHKLKVPIIGAIQEHHGNSLVYYFYRRALDKQDEVRKLVEEGKAREEDIPEVNEEDFRYPGPLPQTKESAIISLADSVESASRSLEKPTHSKIEQLVEDIVTARIKDGQLDDCDLTLREVALIKESFTKTLISMLHTRIAYPKAAKRDDDTETKNNPSATKRLRVIDAA
jgi:putative nucleotidyltransferase with HDIG domain